MLKKISIIVPTYNVEKYISKCLDSLVAQDYPNYDVLVVNDGSPYNEQVIIDDYQARYPEIIKAIRKENGGYGSVLQLAIAESDAEYILVCDPDDYLDSKALSTLYSYMQDGKVDLVVGAKKLVYSDNDEIKYDKSYNSEFGELKDHQIYEKGTKEFETLYFLEPSPHAKLYQRSVVKNINFPTKVSYTDNLLYFYALTRAQRVTYCSEALSYYLINREGNTRTDLKPTIIDAWVTVFSNILNQVNDGDDIFYYRIFEGFYSIYYKVENINADISLKQAKYDLIYSLIPPLFDHEASIRAMLEKYHSEGKKMLVQKLNLLNPKLSKKTYDKMVHTKLYGSFKQKTKQVVLDNKYLSKLYDKYHFFAKYIYASKKDKLFIRPEIEFKMIYDQGTNFFGYYDKPAIFNQKCLYHQLASSSLALNQTINIMVDDKVVSTTNAWNWQQGSMASWVDDKHIMHNYFDGQEYRSKLVNIEDLSYQEYCFPIYSLSKDCSFALSLNFSRLAKLRPDYGYFNLPYQNLRSDDEDGIYYLDLKNNEVSLWLTLSEIKAFKPRDNMQNAIHKINHIDISLSSDKAIFLHRWYDRGVKYTRLLCVDIKTKNLSLLADNDMVSHMAWYGNDMVFGYLRGANKQDGYFFIDMEGNQKMFKHNLLIDDGHPTVMNERYIVTDTYPDYTCHSKLLLIDLIDKDVTILGTFYSGIKYQGVKRCDLHPRFDDDHKCLSFDSVFEGRRRICHMNLDKLIKDKV